MTMNLAETTKADVYAVAQDLAERLERQIAINNTLRAELTELAARPCLACAVAPTNAEQLEGALQHALLLLDGVDKSELQLTPRWSEWTSFLRERAQLWEIYNRLTRAQKGA